MKVGPSCSLRIKPSLYEHKPCVRQREESIYSVWYNLGTDLNSETESKIITDLRTVNGSGRC